MQLEALQFSSFIQNVISSCGRVGGSPCKVCVRIGFHDRRICQFTHQDLVISPTLKTLTSLISRRTWTRVLSKTFTTLEHHCKVTAWMSCSLESVGQSCENHRSNAFFRHLVFPHTVGQPWSKQAHIVEPKVKVRHTTEEKVFVTTGRGYGGAAREEIEVAVGRANAASSYRMTGWSTCTRVTRGGAFLRNN